MGKAFSKNGNKFSRSRQATVALGTDQNRWCTPVQARPQLAVPRITVSPPRNPTQGNAHHLWIDTPRQQTPSKYFNIHHGKRINLFCTNSLPILLVITHPKYQRGCVSAEMVP
eukprot:Gregarina_sp_Poly_1__3235@NODE_1920_length_3080_cov_105_681713_g1238_i0_p7_GENE_NODE_1920_length_3080_cov_105_681713_g1238_i0NODE_1920_length_3080_cov_105_681713_g1238_i0_p7_ORF_typecomplete_len113_score5_46ABC_trans_aux/PF03886_13/0_11_NODE_1920_length_3080_cov_105_681713_g1238_i072410